MKRLLLGALCAVCLAHPLAAQEREEITVAALTFVSSAPLFIAQERGYYEEEGLDVTFEFFRAAQPVAVAIASGDADFGVTAFTAGFYNLAGNGALKVIGAQSREEPGFEFSAYLASNEAWEAGLRSPEELPGHELGMTQRGSSFHLMLGLLADKVGFNVKDVKLTTLEAVPNMISAVSTNQVDAVILPGWIARRVENEGQGHVIGWVHEYTPYQLGGLFTSSRNIEERPEVVERFVRAYQRGAADYAEAFHQFDEDGERVFGEEAEALIPIIQQYTDATPEAIKASASYIDPEGALDVGSVYQQVEWFKKEGLVGNQVDAADFIDLSFIDSHFNLPE